MKNSYFLVAVIQGERIAQGKFGDINQLFHQISVLDLPMEAERRPTEYSIILTED